MALLSCHNPRMSDSKDFFSIDPSPALKSKGETASGKQRKNDLILDSKAQSDISRNKLESFRQSRVSWVAFLVAQLLLMLLFAVCAWWFYHAKIQPQLKLNTVTAPATPAVDTSGLEASLSRASTQISALQNQLDAQRAEREKTQARLQEMADRMALVIQQSSFVPSPNAATSASSSDASQVAALMPSVSPSTSELILLKERNRLSEYADKAIALGSRDDLQAIVDAMFDPAMKHLNHACQAEFRRVQNYYEYSVSIDPGFTLPLQELFKDGSVTAEADLTTAQLTRILQETKGPWENRLRAAYLLRASTDKDTNAALLKSLKEDPSLDVAKQAQTTFEKRVGRKFRLFDIPTIEAWLQTQKSQ